MQQGMGAGLSSQVSGNMAAAAAAAAGGWAGGSLAGMGAADAVLGSAALSGGWGTVGGAAAAGGAGRSIEPMQAAVLSGAVSPAAGGYGGQAGGWGFWGGGAAAGMSSAGGGGAAAGSTLQMYSYQPPSEDLLMVRGSTDRVVCEPHPTQHSAPAICLVLNAHAAHLPVRLTSPAHCMSLCVCLLSTGTYAAVQVCVCHRATPAGRTRSTCTGQQCLAATVTCRHAAAALRPVVCAAVLQPPAAVQPGLQPPCAGCGQEAVQAAEAHLCSVAAL
jgi:hypothetical protein